MNVSANVDIDFEIDEEDLDIETHVIAVLEEQLSGYISGIKDNDLCSLGEQLRQTIRLTVREMLADPTC
jgi:cytidylate kinase